MRPEATGYGQVYFAEEMLNTRGDSLKDKVIAISGSGNVAQHLLEGVAIPVMRPPHEIWRVPTVDRRRQWARRFGPEPAQIAPLREEGQAVGQS